MKVGTRPAAKLPVGAREYRAEGAPRGKPFLGGVQLDPQAGPERLDQVVIHFYNEKTGLCHPRTLRQVLEDAAAHYGEDFSDILGFVKAQDPDFPSALPSEPTTTEISGDGGRYGTSA